jgi:hypothetical protein
MITEFSADVRGHGVWKFGIALDLAAAGSGAPRCSSLCSAVEERSSSGACHGLSGGCRAFCGLGPSYEGLARVCKGDPDLDQPRDYGQRGASLIGRVVSSGPG